MKTQIPEQPIVKKFTKKIFTVYSGYYSGLIDEEQIKYKKKTALLLSDLINEAKSHWISEVRREVKEAIGENEHVVPIFDEPDAMEKAKDRVFSQMARNELRSELRSKLFNLLILQEK